MAELIVTIGQYQMTIIIIIKKIKMNIKMINIREAKIEKMINITKEVVRKTMINMLHTANQMSIRNTRTATPSTNTPKTITASRERSNNPTSEQAPAS